MKQFHNQSPLKYWASLRLGSLQIELQGPTASFFNNRHSKKLLPAQKAKTNSADPDQTYEEAF